MGFRFRKSFGKGPFRITFSKSGISSSFGGKGARITKKANGNISTTIGIPGSGISYTSEHSKKAKKASSASVKKITTVTNNMDYNVNQVQNHMHDQNCQYEADPFVPDSPERMGFIRVLRLIGIGVGVFLFTLIISLIIDNPVFLGWGMMAYIGYTIFIATKKWRQQYKMLKYPVPFSEWEDYTITPPQIPGLSSNQQVAYAKIFYFCDGNASKIFSPAELNQTCDEPVSSYLLNQLHDLGFLDKPSRGKYCLNATKASRVAEQYDNYLAKRQQKYANFVLECQNYNEKAHAFNVKLTEKRNKKI